MNQAQITELFIRAAEIDKKLPNTAKPATMKSMSLGHVHSFEDMAHWGTARLEEQKWAWLDPDNLRLSKNDVGIWLASTEVIKLCPAQEKRRALWAWARSEAGGKSFSRWCQRVEGVSRQLGNWRRNKAIEQIALSFQSNALLHNDIHPEGGFTNDPEIRDKKSNIEFWRADDAKPICSFDEDLQDFSWSNRQNELRRQREARKRQREAA